MSMIDPPTDDAALMDTQTSGFDQAAAVAAALGRLTQHESSTHGAGSSIGVPMTLPPVDSSGSVNLHGSDEPAG